MSFLRIEGVSKGFAVTRGAFAENIGTLRAADDISLDIAEGEIVGLVGESGCGKSTLAKMVMGLVSPDRGKIFLDDRELPPLSVETRPFQMIFQDPFSSLNPRMRIGRSVEEPLLAKSVPADVRKKAVIEALHSVGLSESDAFRYPHQFSGGQRQRIAIARALITNPRFVVCDEAVSALDASVRAQILNLLSERWEKIRFAALFISHDLSVVGYIADRIAVMYLGRIVEVAMRNDLIRHPLHPYTKILLDNVLTLDNAGKNTAFSGTTCGEPSGALRPPTGCAFHTRCPQCMDICSTERPHARTLPNGRMVACHLYEEIK